MHLKICTFNAKGLASKEKRTKLFEFLKLKKYNICLIQEMHCIKNKDEQKWKTEWKHDIILSGNKSNSQGVGILINNNINCNILEYNDIISGRLQSLKLEINDETIMFINVYGPNTYDKHFLDTLQNLIVDNNNETLIIGGDFNVVLNSEIDKLNGKDNTNKQSTHRLNNILENNDLHDIWRLSNPQTKSYTWHSNTKPPIFCRLDYFLVSQNLINTISNCNISPGYRSDHSFVNLNIDLSRSAKGPGYFKFNNNILLNKEYQNIIRNAINETVQINNAANPNTLWEIIKGTIRNETIKYSAKIKKENENEITEIENTIKRIEKKLTLSTDKNNLIKELNEQKTRLNYFLDEKTKSILLRTKAEWIEGAEKNTKYFANLEKKQASERSINKIIHNGVEKTKSEEIIKDIYSFYSNLYKKDINIQTDNNFFPDNNKKLNDEQKKSCEGLLTEYECGKALKEMQNRKSPGSDGITTEFYKIFWNDIKRFLVNSLNFSFQNKNLTELQKQSVISLLPKKDKLLTDINNWRPISLLNIDYKIASKSIANRIKNILANLINEDQTGFIKGRYIGENVRILYDIIEQINKDNEKGIIFFSDFHKAFDSVNHDYMFECLKYFNFGETLINWVKLFYNDAQSCINVNGHLSNFFKIDKGVRQGCPLSPYLFLICIEILSLNINNNNNIKGINIFNNEIKQTLFADDASFFLDGTEISFQNLVTTFEKFSQISGLKLNISKCTVLRIGTLRYTNKKFCKSKKFVWTSNEASTLGICFSNDHRKIHELNLEPKINAFQHTLYKWKRWKLSLIGKITVLKSYAFPKLVYPLTVLPNPTEPTIKRIKNIMFDFLWDSKPDKISRDTIYQTYENGGLKMLDIESFINALKASWIKRLITKSNAKWNKLYNSELNKFGGTNIWKYNTNVNDASNFQLNFTFLKQILTSWCKINYNKTVKNLAKEFLWNNSNLKQSNGNTLLYKDWQKK